MGLSEISKAVLVALSSLLGVDGAPIDPQNLWSIDKNWQSNGEYWQMQASSDEVVSQCQADPTQSILFPMIIHGAHQVFLDGVRIQQFGSPDFKSAESFYGRPVVSCERVTHGKSLSWKAYSYTRYFARFSRMPSVEKSWVSPNLSQVTLNIMAAGSLLVLSVFSFTFLWKKVSWGLTWALSLSCLTMSGYFFGNTSGYTFQGGMLPVHKFADIALWIGLLLFMISLHLNGLFGKTLVKVYAAHIALAVAIISVASDGDTIQLGTTIPFGMTFFCLGRAMHSLYLDSRSQWLNAENLLRFASLGAFALACFNDMFVVTGVVEGVPLLSLGIVMGLLFMVLGVNVKIMEAYQERDHLRSNLESEVHKQTLQINEQNQQLEAALSELKQTQAELVQSAKMASLGTLSAGIAHEINNSINYVNGALPAMHKFTDSLTSEEDKEKYLKLMGVMKSGLDLTVDIIGSLRNYSGLNKAKFKRVELEGILHTVLNILRPKIRDRYVVAVDIEGGLEINCKVVGMNEVLMNLINNAMDAMPDGGKIHVSAFRNEKGVQIQVADEGEGIQEADLTRIFDPFFTTKAVGKGTGLGLHIIKKEIESHKGSISVDSAPNKGTTFTISLPDLDLEKLREAA